MLYINTPGQRPLALRHAADALQALGHPVRLQIMSSLRGRPRLVTSLVAELGLPQPLVSRHLAVLRAAGLVAVTTAGRKREYRIAAGYGSPLLAALFPLTNEATSS